MKLAIGINIFREYERQDHCINTLIKLSKKFPEITLYNITFRKCESKHPQFIHLPFLKNHAYNIIPESKSNIPVANEFFEILSQQDCDYFMYLNSDVLPSSNLIKLILKQEYETYAVSRHEVLPINDINDNIIPFKIEIAGFDAWVCKKEWWLQNKNLFKKYIVGNHLWDVDYAITMFQNSNGKLCNKKFYLAHEKHTLNWNDKSPEATHNAKLFQTTPFHEKWHEFIFSNLIKRKPYGQFLEPLLNEEELENKLLKI